MKKYLAELIGTFALVFFGTGSIVVNQVSNDSFGIVGIAIAFGSIITAIIYTFGSISGAHINPAVTISLATGKMMPKKDVLPYIIAQIIGAILASLLLKVSFPDNDLLGTTLPTGGVSASIIMEFVMTYFLMITILGVTSTPRTEPLAGIVIGGFVLGAIFIAGPISGGAFNPARSIGPALLSGHLESLWLYLVVPTIGAIAAMLTWKFIND